MELTHEENIILEAIKNYMAECKIGPSARKLNSMTGIKSRSKVKRICSGLIDKGELVSFNTISRKVKYNN